MLVLMDQDHIFDHICSYRMPGLVTSSFCSHKKVFLFSRTVGLSRRKGEVIPIISFLLLIDDIPLRYYLVQIITVKATSERIVLYLIKKYMFTYLSEFLYKSKPELSVVIDNFLLGWCSTNCSISIFLVATYRCIVVSCTDDYQWFNKYNAWADISFSISSME